MDQHESERQERERQLEQCKFEIQSELGSLQSQLKMDQRKLKRLERERARLLREGSNVQTLLVEKI